MQQTMEISRIIVLGSGNWGLALASLFCRNLPTRVWTVNAQLAEEINASRDCPGEFFPHPLPDSLVVEEKYSSEFDERRTLVVLAVPSSQVGKAAAELATHTQSPLVLTVSKGFDAEHQCTMSELVKRHLPKAAVVILTGPTIASEVAAGKPTRAILASDNLMYLAMTKEALQNDVLSFEVSRNPTHHEICAALKGIVAIAAGMADGLGMGANAQGILMTEGIHEMGMVASFFGIPESVAYGISGAADLITTCVSQDSRNRRLGALLAQGKTLRQALDEVNMTVEGVSMSKTIETLWALDVSIPLFHMVNRILLVDGQDIRAELHRLILSI